MPTSVELRKERADLVEKSRSILKLAETEKRSTLKAEEQQEYDRILADVDARYEMIQRVEKQEKLDASLQESAGRSAKPATPSNDTKDNTDGGEERSNNPRATKEYNAAFVKYLRTGREDLDTNEKRSLFAGSDTKGGFLVPPEQLLDKLIKFVDNEVFIRQLGTVLQTTASESIGAPSFDTDVDDSDWTTELKTGNESTGEAFGKRELTPRPLAKRIKVSNKLLRLLKTVDTFILSRLAYKFGITQEKGFLLGNGNQQPLGVFVADARGISTTRDVAVGDFTGSTAGVGDGLFTAFYTLKAQYQKTCQWLVSREFLKRIRQLKDTQGRYLWEPALVAGQPDRLINRPLNMSEYVPTTFTSGNYIAMLADFSFYWIADALTYEIQRLSELYAETNQTGFIARAEVDGMPVLEEAFVRLKV
jgi:HK97 family phage major capsid protein